MFFLGKYVCAKCKHDLFSSKAKYKHSSPWPAFSETLRADSLVKRMETQTAYKVYYNMRYISTFFCLQCILIVNQDGKGGIVL